MCGILVVFSKKKPLIVDEILTMRDQMIHRGPDDAGLHMACGNRLALAHRRLSILDLSARAHQPMESEGGNVITYNGEIYNYLELKDQFLSDTVLESKSDTSVLLHMLEKWGKDALPHLNGMWGFVFYDSAKSELIISRDRFGIKPLYYYNSHEVLIISSEIKPILKSSFYTKKINEQAIDIYLKTGLVDGIETTFFHDVKRFPSGSFSIYSLKVNSLEIEKFYTIEDSTVEVSDNRQENIQHFKDLFSDSVRIRLRSDVAVGTCLSGGLDSSSIYSMAVKNSPNRLSAFSAKFRDKNYDESYFYKKVVEKYPGNLHEVQPTYDNFEEKLKTIIYYLEEPSKAMGVFPQWHVMKLASKHVKVILNGQGGDEILAGYDPYQYFFILDTIKNNLFRLPQSLVGLGHTKGFPYLIRLPYRLLYILLRNRNAFNGSFLSGKLLRDTYSLMLPALLRYEDKLGMAFSIEARLPFLDYRLVNFSFSLNETYKIENGWSKYILRQSMKDVLPYQVAFRKDKKGFPTPFNSILEQNTHLKKRIPPQITDEWVKWRYLSLSVWRDVYEI